MKREILRHKPLGLYYNLLGMFDDKQRQATTRTQIKNYFHPHKVIIEEMDIFNLHVTVRTFWSMRKKFVQAFFGKIPCGIYIELENIYLIGLCKKIFNNGGGI